jgi:hypothetical protein
VAALVGVGIAALDALTSPDDVQPAPGPTVPPEAPDPFVGSWWSVDGDGSNQTLAITAAGDGYEVVVEDELGSGGCQGAPARVSGTGEVTAPDELTVAVAPMACEEGETFPDVGPLVWTLDPATGALTDNYTIVWYRSGTEPALPSPPPEDFAWTGIWPQDSEEAGLEAQRLADMGDPSATWQVSWPCFDPRCADPARFPGFSGVPAVEVASRYATEVLGWEGAALAGLRLPLDERPRIADDAWPEGADWPEDWAAQRFGWELVRCQNADCRNTRSDAERVRLRIEQLVRYGVGGIWVVTGVEEIG